MSIVELSKSVDTLAKLINQKNQELESLKKNYDQKLGQINDYIEMIQKDEPQTKLESIEDGDFLNKINERVTCPNCDHEIWNNESKESDYLLIPKKKLKYLLEDSVEFKQLRIKDDETHTYKKHAPLNNNGKSKRVCSYCHKPGHQRARCFKRLNSET